MSIYFCSEEFQEDAERPLLYKTKSSSGPEIAAVCAHCKLLMEICSPNTEPQDELLLCEETKWESTEKPLELCHESD